jgi:hypothetical protein
MDFTLKELEMIRYERMKEFNIEVNKFNFQIDNYNSVMSFNEKLKILSNNIVKVEEQLNEFYPNWNECPF